MNVTRSTMICIWAIKCKKLNPILFLSLLIFLWTVDTWNHQFLSVDWLLISQFSWRDYVFLKGRRIDNKEGMIKKGENLFSTTPLDSCFYWSHTLSKNYTCLLFKICWNIFCLFVCFVFFIWVFFHNHPWITGLQGKREGISLTPHYHFHPFFGMMVVLVPVFKCVNCFMMDNLL